MYFKKQLPNLLTLANLFCGCIALVYVADFNFEYAFYFVCLGIFFDFFDGFFARKFDVAGPLGVQLDSLADMVTSGVVPGYTMVYLLSGMQFHMPLADFLPYIGFVITLGACYRLANFNIDTRQSDSFIGLPTPANTLFIMSLPLVLYYQGDTLWATLLENKYVLLSITFLSAYVMNAPIPLFSLKIKDFSVAKYKLQIGFVLFAIALILLLRVVAVPLIIVSYVLFSVGHTILTKK